MNKTLKPFSTFITLAILLFASCSNNTQYPTSEDAHKHDHSEGAHTHEDGTTHADHTIGSPSQEEFSVVSDSTSEHLDSAHNHGNGSHTH